jgi:hypothetical protein
MITMVLMYQVSCCLINFSHTLIHGLTLPLGIAKNDRRGHRRSLCPFFGGEQSKQSSELRPVPAKTDSAPLNDLLGRPRSLLCAT